MDNRNKVTMINPLLVPNNPNHKTTTLLSNEQNKQLNEIGVVTNGSILNGKYVIIEKLAVSSGEAHIYTCKYDNEYYIAKVFKHGQRIKKEVLEILKSIDSKYIEKVVDYFILNDGRHVEITPYYNQGTLDNQKRSIKELKEIIIPSLNEAIHELHKNKLIHMDIKPSNIMISNDLSHVVLIDFGSAIIMKDEKELIFNKDINFTYAYSAPETNTSGQCSIYSDFYSMGITLYELLLGHSPFVGLSKEQIVRFMQTNRIAFDDDTDLDLKDLILGLTYRDIANRNDYKNVNNRWSYQQVKDWLDGKTLVVPGEGVLSNTNMIPFVYKDQYYTEVDSLIEVLATNWNDGVRFLSDKHLSNHFKNINHRYYEICIDFESRFFKGKVDKDKEFFEFIYTLLPKLEKFYFKGKVFESIQDLGYCLKKQLDTLKSTDKAFDFYEQILESGVLSLYCKLKSIDDEKLLSIVKNLENSSKINFTNQRNKQKTLYTLSYTLNGQKEYELDGTILKSKEDLIEYITKVYKSSFNDLTKLCRTLMPRRMLDVKLEAWLCALGHYNEVVRFNRIISNEEE